MGNCLVAQSGGPTAVINASLAGVIRANQLNPIYDRVFGGIHGVEGVLQGKLYDLTDIPASEIEILKQTPSSALGTCRYKLKRGQEADFKQLVAVMDENNIDTMFYIGGNDSMDTVDALSEWAAANGSNKRFIGIPKTVDNDLVPVDHCPGFPSAAKFACQVTHATKLDYDAYTRPEVFVLETMGRDAGWLAASCCLTGDVDLLVLPEVDFDRDAFLAEVKRKMDEKGSCYIVVSEGAHYADGTYVSAGDSANDGFAHAVLGGAALTVKQMIIDAGIAPRGIVQDLSRAARSSNFAQSKVDVTEAYELGMSAHMRSANPEFTAQVVGVRRGSSSEMNCEGGVCTMQSVYNPEFFAGPASEFANYVKHFPKDWILPNYQGVTAEALDYFRPLVAGEPDIVYNADGLPKTVKPYNLR
jgi:6-phosphofructokinase 1